jgi:retinol-binding protein 3
MTYIRKPFDIQDSINGVCECLEKNYIFPDVAEKCSKYLRHQLQQGSYDAISDPDAFAQAVTADLRLLSEDKHIEIKAKRSQNQIRPETENDEIAYLKSITYGLGTYNNLLLIGFIKELPQHFGYLEVHGFQAVDKNDSAYKKFPNAVRQTRTAVDKAIEEISVKKPKSIIIDLRNNGGGSPYGVQLLCSYFLPANTPLNTIRWRKKDGISIEERNTLSYEEIPKEKRLMDVPLYILTSHRTFSAGEEFANNMKALNRATLIGEITMGGANPGGSHQLNDFFEIFIPDGQSINPHNGSNWEGIGVIPDLFVPADEALDHSLSLTTKF